MCQNTKRPKLAKMMRSIGILVWHDLFLPCKTSHGYRSRSRKVVDEIFQPAESGKTGLIRDGRGPHQRLAEGLSRDGRGPHQRSQRSSAGMAEGLIMDGRGPRQDGRGWQDRPQQRNFFFSTVRREQQGQCQIPIRFDKVFSPARVETHISHETCSIRINFSL